MEVSAIIATALSIQFVQVRSEFDPQGQQFFALGLFLLVVWQGGVIVQVVEAFMPHSGALGRHAYDQIDQFCFRRGL